MRLAINYSPEAERLHKEKQINFDLFKTPNWHDMVSTASAVSQVYVHFDLDAGDHSLPDTDWNEVNHFLDLTYTQNVNLHLVAPASLDCSDRIQLNEYMEQTTEEVCRVVNRYGKDRIILENIPFPLVGLEHLRAAADPDLINYVVRESGCGLLLDIAHARISAMSLGVGEQEYINQLPMDRLRELHVTGLGINNGRINDHLAMSDPDWINLAWALDRIRSGDWAEPDIVAFEYGGTGDIFRWRSDPEVIACQLPRLFRMIHPLE